MFLAALSRIGFNKKEDKMKVNWKYHIVSTPDVIRGKPRIKGTRIPASLILGYFVAGNTIEEIIAEFPAREWGSGHSNILR